MKKSSVFLIFICCLGLFLMSFIYGYYFIDKKISKRPNYDAQGNDVRKKYVNIDEYDDMEILKEEERISPNTYIEKRTYYNKCNHNTTTVEQAKEEIINMSEKQFRKYIEDNYPNIRILSFSIKKIVLREDRNHLCTNHYIIGESEGRIAIFRINENGEKILNKIFKDYPLSLLKEVDQDKLREGIVVDTEEELSDVLENFIS